MPCYLSGTIQMINISAVFQVDYFGSQIHCCMYLDGKEYWERFDEEMQEFIFNYIEENIIDEIKSPNINRWYWVLKEGKSLTGSVAFNDDFTIEYDIRGAALKDKSQIR